MMTSSQLKRYAAKFLKEMEYSLEEWAACRNGWAFGFVKKGNKNYGCIAFACTGLVCIEILDNVEEKKFNI
jgi:hypothetical protein